MELTEGFPRAFGPYALLSAFAHGGMGEVYLAKSGGIAGIDRLCVLKKLRPDLVQNEEYVNRFLDEARLVVQLNHANIANVFDVGKVGTEYYLAMEYVSGVSMKGLLNRAESDGRRIPPDVVVFMMAEALEGLDYAHRLEHPATGTPLNLVHRDISPHNIMVSYEGEVKLIDFGLAASELKEEQTESQVVMGKVAYMAPEQARGERVKAACDQFAAGIVFYELLTGERFYGDMNNYQIWQVVGRGGFTPRKWTELDEELMPILGRALHPDAASRWATCGDFKDALMGWMVRAAPKTNRRRVRAEVASMFDGDTKKERNFLAQFADVNPAELRADTGSGSSSSSLPSGPASMHLVQTGEDMTMTATSFDSASAPTAARPEATLAMSRGDTDSTATHMLAAGVTPPSKRSRAVPLAAAAVLLVVGSATAGYFAMRSPPPPVAAKAKAPAADQALLDGLAEVARLLNENKLDEGKQKLMALREMPTGKMDSSEKFDAMWKDMEGRMNARDTAAAAVPPVVEQPDETLTPDVDAREGSAAEVIAATAHNRADQKADKKADKRADKRAEKRADKRAEKKADLVKAIKQADLAKAVSDKEAEAKASGATAARSAQPPTAAELAEAKRVLPGCQKHPGASVMLERVNNAPERLANPDAHRLFDIIVHACR